MDSKINLKKTLISNTAALWQNKILYILLIPSKKSLG